MTATRETVGAWHCICNRCAHEWWTLSRVIPRCCAKCKSDYWNNPRKYKRGRARKKVLTEKKPTP